MAAARSANIFVPLGSVPFASVSAPLPVSTNNGAQPIDQPVRKTGPAAYFSTLPIKAMRHAIEQAGLAAEVSQTAGTFVCNHVFYALMHALKKQRGATAVRGSIGIAKSRSR